MAIGYGTQSFLFLYLHICIYIVIYIYMYYSMFSHVILKSALYHQ